MGYFLSLDCSKYVTEVVAIYKCSKLRPRINFYTDRINSVRSMIVSGGRWGILTPRRSLDWRRMPQGGPKKIDNPSSTTCSWTLGSDTIPMAVNSDPFATFSPRYLFWLIMTGYLRHT